MVRIAVQRNNPVCIGTYVDSNNIISLENILHGFQLK